MAATATARPRAYCWGVASLGQARRNRGEVLEGLESARAYSATTAPHSPQVAKLLSNVKLSCDSTGWPVKSCTVKRGLRENRTQEGTWRFYRFHLAATRRTRRFYRVSPFLSTTRNRKVTEISVTTELGQGGRHNLGQGKYGKYCTVRELWVKKNVSKKESI